MKLHRKAFLSLSFVFAITIILFYSKVLRSNRIDSNIISMRKYFFKKSAENTNERKLKYILQWTSDENIPFADMGVGQEGFINRKCPYTNCYVTSNKSYFSDYRDFDVVAFSGPDLSSEHIYFIKKPELRSPHQKYVFGSIESPDNYPICSTKYNNFFNWTWTYKLDSEVQWGYVVIRDKNNKVIGPKKDMKWLKPQEMQPVSDEFKMRLRSKSVAAAWLSSNCDDNNGRHMFTRRLQIHLYLATQSNSDNYTVDIFGDCGPFRCSRDTEEICDNMIRDKYYFYLSFENSISEDYVTEKLLRAVNNDAVPIVFGGADYSRFLPEGSYLDARKLGVYKLAQTMVELMNDTEKYADYFKWKNHYTYHHTVDSVETNEYCRFCALLNDDDMMRKHSVYTNFKRWWNSPRSCVSLD